MSSNVLQDDHDALLAVAQKLIDGAEAKGEMSAQEERLFNGIMDKAAETKSKADKRAAAMPGYAQTEMPESEAEMKVGETSRGAGSKILRRGESYKDHLVRTGRAKNEDRDVTLTGFIRGLIGLSCSPAEKRALAEGATTTGGAMVPVYLSGMWFDALRAQAVAYKAGAAALDMMSSELDIAKLVSDPSVGWYAENSQITESDQVFDKVSLVAKSLAVLTQVPIQLVEDAPNAGVLLTNSLTQAIAIGLDSAVFNGSGTANQPTGIKNQTGINTYSMGANGLAPANYDPLLEAQNLMQLANVYKDPTAAVMSPRTAKEFAELKTTYGQYLAKPDSISKLPFLITTSIPVTETQGTASTASSIYVGDYTQCIIGMRANIRLQALVERFADYLQVGLLAYIRADVAVAHAPAFTRIEGVL